MARGDTLTKLPLDRWAQLLGIHPLHFNGITSQVTPVTTCSSGWTQHPWQNAMQVSREDVAIFIRQAEDRIENFLGFRLAPTWEAAEDHPTPAPGIAEIFNLGGRDARGFPLSVQTSWGHYISGGVERLDLIQAGAVVTYSDEDGDGFTETATIQVTSAVAVDDPVEVAVYFPGTGAAPEWEIRPLKGVSFSGEDITITVHRYQLVDPALWERMGTDQSIDGDDDANFVNQVDVYRRWNDPQTQVSLIWQPQGGFCGCNGADCGSCTLAVQTGCLFAKNPRLGMVAYQPAEWSADDGRFVGRGFTQGRNPDRVRLSYRAGYRNPQRPGVMNPNLERAVVYYSLALLDRSICGCHNLEAVVKLWAEDLALNWGNPTSNASFQVSSRLLDNPFGTKRGEIEAWRIVNQMGLAIGRAVKV